MFFIAILAHSASKFSKIAQKLKKLLKLKRGIKKSVFYIDFKIVENFKKATLKSSKLENIPYILHLFHIRNFLGDFFGRVLYQRKHLRFLNRILVDKLRF